MGDFVVLSTLDSTYFITCLITNTFILQTPTYPLLLVLSYPPHFPHRKHQHKRHHKHLTNKQIHTYKHYSFIKGAVDSEDLPLSLSREKPQNSTLLRRIREVITRKFLRFLAGEFVLGMNAIAFL